MISEVLLQHLPQRFASETSFPSNANMLLRLNTLSREEAASAVSKPAGNFTAVTASDCRFLSFIALPGCASSTFLLIFFHLMTVSTAALLSQTAGALAAAAASAAAAGRAGSGAAARFGARMTTCCSSSTSSSALRSSAKQS